ncbi:60_t:CDS:2 [Diversispora eburnea]|uniref:60_t:CDS:1 n=1 Tax=Diversispora eburnea TaxID=1213867 RepID=A0A9N9AJQ1_9GLOM|nr:60_t:CDS:2 [Diversispora eburnea]
MSRNIQCPIIKVIRQKEFIYPACKECSKKPELLPVKDKLSLNSITCDRCKVTCNTLDLTYRYRLCLLISIDDDYLQRVLMKFLDVRQPNLIISKINHYWI